jgi:choline dehydrogenase-like flavoprotein
VGTPRLLFNSQSSAHPNGLGNQSGMLGRNLMLHPLAYVEAVFDQDLQSSLGPHGACLLSQQFYETNLNRDFIRGYTLQVLRGAPPAEIANTGFLMRQIPLGENHHKKFHQVFNRTAGIAVISEDLPESHNRVELDNSNCDSSGMPGIMVHYKLSDNTKKMLKHGLESSKQVLQAAGGKVTTAFAPVKHTGWHLMGTACMGDDPDQSVVNKYCQVHGVSNLFVVDSSVFVTSGAVNPVATAQAITLLACDFICQQKSGQIS